ncbi:MAG: metallopeptidase family protein [Actinomycetota bacterium]|nr:metallopeptidase family protein [Actinomycetota bacterium]
MKDGEPFPGLEEFQEMVEEVLEGLPPDFKRLMENLAVVVEDVASSLDAARAGVRNPMQLLGTYTGVPFIQWGRDRTAAPPDIIKIYRLPILSVASGAEEIKDKVRKVVLHEVGHRAGLDERRLRELGVY